MGNLNFGQIAKAMSPKGWAIVGGSLVAAIAFLVIVMQMASAPSYSTLMAGIDPAQTGKITSTLSAQGISYQIQNGGTAIAVQPAQTAQARIALATAGLLTNQQPGFSLLNNSSLGQSNFQQQITYQRALEGQLASTIESINGVSSAEVNLVLPNSQDQLFSNNTQAATASVLLGGSALQASQVRGIAQLVASSVPGLSLQKVTVTGPDGSQLWPTAGASDGSGGLLSEASASQHYDTTIATAVNAQLAQTLGPNKAQVVVNANVNANQATQDQLVYAKKGVPLTSQTSTESLKGGNGGSGGVAGAAANIPGYAAGAGAGVASNYSNKTTNTTFGVNKTIIHTVLAPGNVVRQSVALTIDKSVPASEVSAIRSFVANAVGLQTKRGDTMSVGQLAFARPPVTTTPTASATSSYMKYAKYGAAGIGSLIFLVFAGRLLRRRERESMAGQPTWLRELEAPRTLASLEQRQNGGATTLTEPAPTEVHALRSPVNVARMQVEDLVERDPDRVAQQVRAWMAEE